MKPYETRDVDTVTVQCTGTTPVVVAMPDAHEYQINFAGQVDAAGTVTVPGAGDDLTVEVSVDGVNFMGADTAGANHVLQCDVPEMLAWAGLHLTHIRLTMAGQAATEVSTFHCHGISN